MQGPTHLALSWYFAEALGVESARERRIVAWSGLAPDIEVLAYAGAIAWYRDQNLAFERVWEPIHRHYTHGIAFVLATGIVAACLAEGPGRRRAAVAGLAMAASLIHNFCDIVGGGATWPIYPLWPLSELRWSASWSWAIGDWPNVALLAACLAGMLVYARFAGRSPMECFGARADAWLVRTVRQEPAPPGTRARPWLRWAIWGGLAAATLAILAPLGFRLPI